MCQSRQPESKTEGEKGRRQNRSITVDAGGQQKSSLVDSSRQRVSTTDGDERQVLTSEVSHHLQVSNSENSGRLQGSVEENTCRQQDLGEDEVVDRMGQTSLDINQQEGWTQSETTQYQRALPAVSSRQQGLLCGKHGRQKALWSSPIRQEESESEKVTACLQLTADSQYPQTELISESGRQHESTSEDTGRQPESRPADLNSRPESSVKDAFQQQKADFIETARRQDLTSSYLCRQQKSKLGVNNPAVIEDPVHRQAVSKCPNQPVEGLISGQAEGSRMVRKTEQTGSTVTYNLQNRQRVFPVLAGYTSDKLRALQEAVPDKQPILRAYASNVSAHNVRAYEGKPLRMCRIVP